jgi:hypothetical protein
VHSIVYRSISRRQLGITTTFEDTGMRAKLLDRMLGELERQDIQ